MFTKSTYCICFVVLINVADILGSKENNIYVDDITEYDVTTIKPITPRIAGHGIRPTLYSFRAFSKTYNLRLVETTHVLSNYGGHGLSVRIIDDSGSKDVMVDFKKEGIRFFQDEDNNGAFTIKLISNNHLEEIALEGILSAIDHDIIIEPLHQSNKIRREAREPLQHVVFRRWRNKGEMNHVDHTKRDGGVGYMYNSFNAESFNGGFAPGSMNGGQETSFYNLPQQSSFVQPQTMVGDIYRHLAKMASYRTQTQITGPVSVYVEMLAWTDLSFVRSFRSILGRDDVEIDILKYIATVTNAANLRYKKGIRDPSLDVSVVLSGAVICKTFNCSEFTEGIKVKNTVDNHAALDKFAETLQTAYNESRFIFQYDYAAAFTRLDITDTKGTPIGVSFTDKICSLVDGKSSSVIEDQGGYSSVGTLVHELGHTLGSDHDGWFRGINCRASDGYIMSSLSPLTKNGFYFSKCSIDSMKKNLAKADASCVYNKPTPNHLYTSLVTDLPGQIYNATEQCRQIYGTHFCLSIGTTLEDICYKMFCWDPVLPNVCSTKSPAALGTSCGPGKWCVGGECIHDPNAP